MAKARRSLEKKGGHVAYNHASADPLVQRVQRWIAQKKESDELVRRWQELERKHTQIAKRQPESSTRGSHRSPKMRFLMQRIRASDRRLKKAAELVLGARATSTAGALAKLQLGLRMQAPSREVSQALVFSGFEELMATMPDNLRSSDVATA